MSDESGEERNSIDLLGLGKALEATGEITKEFRQFCYDIAGPWGASSRAGTRG